MLTGEGRFRGAVSLWQIIAACSHQRGGAQPPASEAGHLNSNHAVPLSPALLCPVRSEPSNLCERDQMSGSCCWPLFLCQHASGRLCVFGGE